MLIELTQTHYGSLRQNVPEVKLHNMYVVQNPMSNTDLSYVTRPVLSTIKDFSPDIIRGFFFQQGFANDQTLVVVGDQLYGVDDTGVSTTLATIQGIGLCKFATTIYGLAIVSGDFLYIYDGTTITEVAIPDAQLPSDVCSLNNYFIVTIRDTNKFYWILPGDVTIDPLAFASAESNPDHIVTIKAVSDELWILGTTTSEVWAPTADVTLPFQRISGRVFNYGCDSPESTEVGSLNGLPCLIWVSGNKEVFLAQGAPNKISNDYVEEMIRASNYAYGGFFRRNRNDFYVLSTNLITLVYDLTFSVWYKWSTFNQPNWSASFFIQKSGAVFGAHPMYGSVVYKFSEASVDNTEDWLVCEVAGSIFYNSKKPLPCSNVEIIANPGYGYVYTTTPLVEMRWSDDQGANWSTYMQGDMSTRGQTFQPISFRSLGLIKTPGRRFEIRFSGTDSFRLDYAVLNNEA